MTPGNGHHPGRRHHEAPRRPHHVGCSRADPMADLLAPYRPHAGELALRQARRCQYPDGSPALRAVASVLLCTGWVRRLLRDPNTGQPLDYNRAQRRFSTRQRRALVIRDGGCVFPGCDRKPKWCGTHPSQTPGKTTGPPTSTTAASSAEGTTTSSTTRAGPSKRPGDGDLHAIHRPRRPPIHPQPPRTMSTLTGCANPPGNRTQPPPSGPMAHPTSPAPRAPGPAPGPARP